MALIVVEAVPVSRKPPMVVVVRISPGERHGFHALAPSSPGTSYLHIGNAAGLVESSPKLVRRIGSRSTRAEEVSPCFARSAAAPSTRLRVFVSVVTSTSVVRRGC